MLRIRRPILALLATIAICMTTVPAQAAPLKPPPTFGAAEALQSETKAAAPDTFDLQAWTQARAAQTQAPAEAQVAATPARVTRLTTVAPGKPSFRNTAPAAAETAPAVRRPTARDQVSVQTVGTRDGYTVTVNPDTFAAGAAINPIVTVTYDGQPVANATLSIGYGAQWGTVTTGANGTAQPNISPMDWPEMIPVGLTTPAGTFIGDNMAEIYNVPSDRRATIVEQVTDAAGQPVQNFGVTFYTQQDQNKWLRWTNTGTIGAITSQGPMWVELFPNSNDALLVQEVPDTGALRRVLHPSVAGTAQVTVTGTLDGVALNGGWVAMHNLTLPLPSYSLHLNPTNVRVSPGSYALAAAFGSNEETIILRDSFQSFLGGQSYTVPLNWNRASLGTVTFAGINGNNSPQTLADVALGDSQLTVSVNPNHPVRIAQGAPHWVTYYRMLLTAADNAQWEYEFNDDYRQTASFDPIGGSTTNLTLGGHVAVQMNPQQHCYQGGCEVWYDAPVVDPRGMRMHEARRDGQPVTGIMRLYKQEGTGETLVDERTVWVNRSFDRVRLPANPYGDYRVTVDYDLGPYQGAAHGEHSFNVPDPASYSMTLSHEVLSPNTEYTVTATLTQGSSPVGGATVRVGWGDSYGVHTTDAAGQVSLTLQTRGGRDVIPFLTELPGTNQMRLANMYVVPDGNSLVMITGFTDRDGNPLRNFAVSGTWYDPWGGWDENNDWTETGSIGMVRPAGTNYIQVMSDYPALIIDREIQVTAGSRLNLQVDSAGTVPLRATWNGADQYVALHRKTQPGPSLIHNVVPSPLYATPGEYSLLAYSEQALAYLLEPQLDLTAGATYNFTVNQADLVRFNTSMADGYNQPMTNGWVRITMPGFALQPNQNGRTEFPRYFLPGYPYRVTNYEYYTPAPTGGEWEYRFIDEGGGSPPVIPVAGQQVNISLGGPAAVHLAPQDGPIIPGQTKRFMTGLYVNGLRFVPHLNWWSSDGNLTLRNPQGATVWSRQINAWDRDVDVPIPPGAAGLYTLESTWNTGPYQGQISNTLDLPIVPPVQVALTATPQILTPDQPTTVTIDVTHDGQPYADVTVQVGNLPPQTPDAQGRVTVQVTARGGEVLPVEARTGTGYLAGRTNLFGLTPGLAAVEVSAVDENGARLEKIWASAETFPNNDQNRRNNWAEAGPIGMTLPAGDAFIQVVREGYEAYLLSLETYLTAGQVTTVQLDAAQLAVLIPTEVRIDGQLSGHSVIGLRRNGNLGLSWLWGVEMDQGGHSPLHITPGQYEMVVHRQNNTDVILAPQGMHDVGFGPGFSFDVATNSLETVTFGATYQGAAQCPTVPVMAGGIRVYMQEVCTLRATSGAYGVDEVRFSLDQPGGGRWTYETRRETPLNIVLQAGAPQQFTWDMTPTGVAVLTRRPTYSPGSRIDYHLAVTTAFQWDYTWIYDDQTHQNRAPTSVEIRDPQGQVVYQNDNVNPDWNNWQTPPSPANSYTINMVRDMGALGPVSGAATVTLAKPAKLSFALTTEILPVGSATSVTATLIKDGLPLPGVQVGLFGETVEYRTTDARGRISFLARPNHVGLWGLQYIDEDGTEVWGYAYAVDSQHGVLDVKAKDRNGNPLQNVRISAPGSEPEIGRPGQQKLILPAGPTTVAVRGNDSVTSYYMTVPATVTALKSTVVTADGAATVPLNVGISGDGPDAARSLLLRNTAVNYTERFALGKGLGSGAPIWVTPGNYELLVRINEGRVVRLLAAGPVTAAPSTGGSVSVSAADATGEYRASFRLPNGAPVDFWHWVSKGRLTLYIDPGATDQVLVTPGEWQATRVEVGITDPQYRDWYYTFSGSQPVTVPANGIAEVALGGALTATVLPQSSVFTIAGTLPVKAGITTPGGLGLESVNVYDRGYFLFSEPKCLEVTGMGYANKICFGGSKVMWDTPATPGLYTLTLHAGGDGPFGPLPTASATVQLIRVSRPIR